VLHAPGRSRNSRGWGYPRREDALAAIDDLKVWLAERGLKLSREKTRIVHLTEGFDFLGFNVRLYPAPTTSRTGYKAAHQTEQGFTAKDSDRTSPGMAAPMRPSYRDRNVGRSTPSSGAKRTTFESEWPRKRFHLSITGCSYGRFGRCDRSIRRHPCLGDTPNIGVAHAKRGPVGWRQTDRCLLMEVQLVPYRAACSGQRAVVERRR